MVEMKRPHDHEPESEPPETEATTLCAEVQSDLDGARADLVLARAHPGSSRRFIKSCARAGLLSVDEIRAPASQRVFSGQRLRLRLPMRQVHERVEPTISHCDEGLLIVSKPSGLHTTGRYARDPESLAAWVAQRFPDAAHASPDARESGALHRLDRDTSGLVAFARNPETYRLGRNAFGGGRIIKRYLAAALRSGSNSDPSAPIHGSIAREDRNDAHQTWAATFLERHYPTRPPLCEHPTLRLSLPLANSPDRKSVVASARGRPAISVITPLIEGGPSRSIRIFAIDIQTGVRHQIRAHMAALGWPLLDDSIYEDHRGADSLLRSPLGSRLGLHAAHLDLSQIFPNVPPISDWPGPDWPGYETPNSD